MKTDLVGKVFKTKKYGDCVITQYVKHSDVTVEFLDTGYVVKVALNHIKSGFVKDKLAPSLYGVGITGDFNKEDMLSKQPEYILWCNMLMRCYSSHYHKNNPNYKDCAVSDNFKYYPYFKDWCNRQVGFNVKDNKGKLFHLDKDILIKGNKVYSEDTCCFIPSIINQLIVRVEKSRGEFPIGVCYDKRQAKYMSSMKVENGFKFIGYFSTPTQAFKGYKISKEQHIKEVANQWKDQIDPRTYEALMNWTVEITD